MNRKKMDNGARTPPADPEEANRKVRAWLLGRYPEEKELIGDFREDVTFAEINRRMHAGEDFYEIADCHESVQREYVFTEMAAIYGTDYDYWFDLWLSGGRETPAKGLVKALMANPGITVLKRSF